MEENDRERWVNELKEPVRVQRESRISEASLAQSELDQLKYL